MLTCFLLLFFFFSLTEVSGLNMCAGAYVWKISKISFESCIYLKGFKLKKVHKKKRLIIMAGILFFLVNPSQLCIDFLVFHL